MSCTSLPIWVMWMMSRSLSRIFGKSWVQYLMWMPSKLISINKPSVWLAVPCLSDCVFVWKCWYFHVVSCFPCFTPIFVNVFVHIFQNNNNNIVIASPSNCCYCSYVSLNVVRWIFTNLFSSLGCRLNGKNTVHTNTLFQKSTSMNICMYGCCLVWNGAYIRYIKACE